jgi:hypothetical protein
MADEESVGRAGPKDLVKKKAPEGEEPKRQGMVRWVLGWVLVPAIVVGLIFGAGLHVGARHPEMWLSRFFLWIFGA